MDENAQFVIRPIRKEDADSFYAFAQKAALGITSMPKNQALLEEKIQQSLLSFTTIQPDGSEYYLFVLSNIKSNEVVGVCGISSCMAWKNSKTLYKTIKLEQYLDFPAQLTLNLLEKTSISQGPSELCSLYLNPGHRKEGLGKLLSLSRLLFIASFPLRFQNKLIAEMRGFVDANNASPFWEGIGRKFLNLSFQDLMPLAELKREIISSYLPSFPIPIDLLPIEVQQSIGMMHPRTLPAFEMLQHEGFKTTPLIDLFDGGPVIEANIENILTIQTSQIFQVADIVPQVTDKSLTLISNTSLDYRCCTGSVSSLSKERVSIPTSVADALEVKTGDIIRWRVL